MIGFEIELKIDCMNDRSCSLRSGDVPFLMRFKRNYFESSKILFSQVFLSSSFLSSASCSYSVFSICLYIRISSTPSPSPSSASISSFCHRNESESRRHTWVSSMFISLLTFSIVCRRRRLTQFEIRNRDIKFAQYLHISFLRIASDMMCSLAYLCA